MDWDEHVCHCHHVSLRKLWHFARREQNRHPSRMSECLEAGTGCGWCIPTLKRIHEQARAGDASQPLADVTAEQYAQDRRSYIQEKKPRHRF